MINNLIDHTHLLTFHQKKPTGWLKNAFKEDKSFVLELFAQFNWIKYSVNTHIVQLSYSKNKMVSYKQIQGVKKFQYRK